MAFRDASFPRIPGPVLVSSTCLPWRESTLSSRPGHPLTSISQRLETMAHSEASGRCRSQPRRPGYIVRAVPPPDQEPGLSDISARSPMERDRSQQPRLGGITTSRVSCSRAGRPRKSGMGRYLSSSSPTRPSDRQRRTSRLSREISTLRTSVRHRPISRSRRFCR